MPDLPAIQPFIEQLQSWMESNANAIELQSPRVWCTMDITDPLVPATFAKVFDQTDLNKAYTEESSKSFGDATIADFALYQLEADLLYSMQKSFTFRHRGRLATYRDSAAQSNYMTYGAISIGTGKHVGFKAAVASSNQQL